MSITSKKRDKDKDVIESTGVQASTDGTTGKADIGTGTSVRTTNIIDTQEAPSRTADKVSRRDDITNNLEEAMIAPTSQSTDNILTEPTMTPSSFDQYPYEQNYQWQREKQQSKILRQIEK